jgi:hypothetical protein
MTIFLLMSHAANSSSLTDVEALLQQPAAMSGVFSQKKKLAILKRPLESFGVFSVAAAQGVIWTVESPSYSQLIITPEGIHFSEQVSDNVGRSMRYVGDILAAILAGDFAALEQQFSVIEITIDDDKQWFVRLQPKSVLMRKGLASIDIQGSNFLSSIKLLEPSGDYTLISLSAIEAFTAVPEAMHILLQTE